MDKYYSYTDFLKALNKSIVPTEAEKLLNDIYLDMFLNHLLCEQRKNQLYLLIDHALDEGNEKSFLQFTKELNEIGNQVQYY